MNTAKKQKTNKYEPNYLLTKTECRHLFEEKLNISRTTYQECFRPQIKFKSHGIIKGRVMRIPYRIAKAFLNRIAHNPQPDDPPTEELKKWQKNPNNSPENW